MIFMKPFFRNIKNISIDGLSVFTAMIVIVTAITITGFYSEKEITIFDEGKETKILTKEKTVGDLLNKENIKLGEYDTLDFSKDTKIRDLPEGSVHILRALPVVLKVDGNEQIVMSTGLTIKDVLKENNVILSDLDYIKDHHIEDRIREGIKIEIIRVREEFDTELEEIPFKLKTRNNRNLDISVEKVIQDGVNGERRITYKTTYENGENIKREVVKKEIVKKSIDKIVEKGTKASVKKISRGDSLRYKKVIDMQATAYCASYEDTGKRPGDPYFGITASGMKARRGVVAIDRKVIPFGTRLYIESLDGTQDYGYAIAGDTGGAIKGNRIDLFYETKAEVNRFGRRNVRVYILGD